MRPILNAVLSLLQLLILLGLGYHYLLLIAGAFKRTPKETLPRSPGTTFAITIPAHNESAVLAKTLEQLKKQTYPAHLFRVYVAADHCQDNTAAVARAHGAVCYERSVEPRGRKAYALQWLLEKVLAHMPVAGADAPVAGADDPAAGGGAAVLIFDADSRVDAGFLSAMDQALCGPYAALQGNHSIADPDDTRFSGLATIDMRLNNLLRNQAKQNLGLSCRLMGDAMCFRAEVIRRHGWPSDSLGEDREYGLYLLTQGIKIGYVPQARSYGQAAPTLKTASTQRVRWYGGVSAIQRAFIVPLLKLALQQRNMAALDQAVELLLPPFSLLAVLTTLITGIQCMWPSLRPVLPATVMAAIWVAWIAFPLIGLTIDRAPAHIYKALLYSPFYIVWRLWAGLKARLLGKRVPWVRTQRREEIAEKKLEDAL